MTLNINLKHLILVEVLKFYVLSYAVQVAKVNRKPFSNIFCSSLDNTARNILSARVKRNLASIYSAFYNY